VVTWKGATKATGGDCLVAWETVCLPKEDGGLGVKDLATQNKSLLLKNLHKLYSGDPNPWAAWIRYWYWDGRASGDSPCWRAMKSLLPLYRSMTPVVLSNGASTSFWFDSWSSAGVLKDSRPALFSHCLDTTISVKTAVALGACGLAWPP